VMTLAGVFVGVMIGWWAVSFTCGWSSRPACAAKILRGLSLRYLQAAQKRISLIYVEVCNSKKGYFAVLKTLFFLLLEDNSVTKKYNH